MLFVVEVIMRLKVYFSLVPVTAFYGLFDGGLYSVLITGIGMDYIPLCSFCHS